MKARIFVAYLLLLIGGLGVARAQQFTWHFLSANDAVQVVRNFEQNANPAVTVTELHPLYQGTRKPWQAIG